MGEKEEYYVTRPLMGVTWGFESHSVTLFWIALLGDTGSESHIIGSVLQNELLWSHCPSLALPVLLRGPTTLPDVYMISSPVFYAVVYRWGNWGIRSLSTARKWPSWERNLIWPQSSHCGKHYSSEPQFHYVAVVIVLLGLTWGSSKTLIPVM